MNAPSLPRAPTPGPEPDRVDATTTHGASGDFYELRLYTTRAGRLADMHHRMGHEVVPLFERHGIVAPLAYWEGLAGEVDALYAYLLRWPGLDKRFRAFRGFYADPDWLAQKTASDAGEFMLDRIDLFLLRPWLDWDAAAFDASPAGGMHELLRIPLAAHAPAEARAALLDRKLSHWRAHGASVLGVFTVAFGGRMPQAVVLLAWPGYAAREAARRAGQADAHPGDTALLGAATASLLRPARYR